jgi:CHAD domain-containing protein
MAIASERGRLIFRKMQRDLRRLSLDQQAETVHSFRTTTRRLEMLLEELISHRDRNQKKLLKVLGRIRKRAGKVRDIDVQLTALRSLKIPQEPRRKTQLMQRLLEIRAQHERKLSKLLEKCDFHDLKRRLKRASDAIGSESGRDPMAVAKKILSVVSVGDKAAASEELLHRYRIAVKRARYAAEFAPQSAETARFIADLKRMQDVLGSWHDWQILTQSAAEHLGEVSQSSLVAALHNVTRGKFRHAVAAVSASRKESIGQMPSPSGSDSARKSSDTSLVSERSQVAA